MKPESITSSVNPKFKLWSDLLTSKGIKQNGLCIVSGRKIIDDVLPHVIVDCVLSTTEFSSDFKNFILAKELHKELDVMGTHTELFIVRTPKLEKQEVTTPQGLEVVTPLADPANLGAVIRSAVAFGVSRIWLTDTSCNPFLPKTLRASAGLSLTAPLVVMTSPTSSATDVGLDMSGEDLQSYKWPKNSRVWVGEEGQGLKNFTGKRLKVSMNPEVESLNATVAASIALYAYRAQHP